MDSMWYFTTWLANHVGSLLIKLPFGSTMSVFSAFLGELLAISPIAITRGITQPIKLYIYHASWRMK